jgi:NAD(P)-dependent dehydrogenase (short-subunit alcohol dehydrogenase family)
MDHLPSFSVTGKIALVTGAARGIGRACSLALAQSGADVALGLRDVNSASDLIRDIESLGRRALPLAMDVSDMGQIRAAVASTIKHFGRIDILVNNVGIAPGNLAEKVTESDFDQTLAVNLKGTFFCCQAAGQVMLAQGSGRIINLSSQAGFVALPTESVYCMTKAAITHLTRCLAVEWGPKGISVNAVAPTFITTPGTEECLRDDDFRKSVIARIPLGRIGEPMEVAAAVVFLASPASSMINGETLLIDGGWTAS